MAPPPAGDLSKRDIATDLDWAIDPKYVPSHYARADDLDFHATLTSRPQRAYTLIDPAGLATIEAYLNPVSGRFGLKALRFDGDARHGCMLLGDWQSRHARPTREQTMTIDGRWRPHDDERGRGRGRRGGELTRTG